ncbi:hypothetical protein GOBAR_DD24877 [Gossypium barbadense]|nr:hypothetical protein GOBAR_DD24877 [Gossypium barbadense]
MPYDVDEFLAYGSDGRNGEDVQHLKHVPSDVSGKVEEEQIVWNCSEIRSRSALFCPVRNQDSAHRPPITNIFHFIQELSFQRIKNLTDFQDSSNGIYSAGVSVCCLCNYNT